MASAGIGSAPHMFWRAVQELTGVNMLHVPYRGGGPLTTDLIGGQVQVMLQRLGGGDRVRQGREAAPLAVTTAARLAVLPDIPTVAEFVPSYEASIYIGVAAPKATPAEIVNKLNKEINLALADARIKQHIAELGDTPLALSAADFGKLIADETEKWGKVIRAAQYQTLARPIRSCGQYSITAVRECDTLLRCTIFSGRTSELGQFLPPSFVAGMEELASIPDAKAGNRYTPSDRCNECCNQK